MVNITGNVSKEEGLAYAQYLEAKHHRKLDSLDVQVNGDEAELDYKFADVPFERIRRITGYLVGDMTHWNNAKTAEEADRVKHMEVV